MKTAKIELTQTQRLSQLVFATLSQWMTEVRNCFARLRRAARGRHDIAGLNDHLLRDIGVQTSEDSALPARGRTRMRALTCQSLHPAMSRRHAALRRPAARLEYVALSARRLDIHP